MAPRNKSLQPMEAQHVLLDAECHPEGQSFMDILRTARKAHLPLFSLLGQH